MITSTFSLLKGWCVEYTAAQVWKCAVWSVLWIRLVVKIILFLLYNSSPRSYSLSRLFQLFILQRLISIKEDMAIFYYFYYLNVTPQKKKHSPRIRKRIFILHLWNLLNMQSHEQKWGLIPGPRTSVRETLFPAWWLWRALQVVYPAANLLSY